MILSGILPRGNAIALEMRSNTLEIFEIYSCYWFLNTYIARAYQKITPEAIKEHLQFV
jgi:hypothetical protein